MEHQLKYTMTPVAVKPVKTKYRRIVTKLPVPQSLPVFRKLFRYEPISMQGQPPLLWDRARGCQVYDRWGNMWLDWSSCVVLANAGHGRPEIVRAVAKEAAKPLLATYVFAHEKRAALCEALAKLAPKGLDKVFLLTTGSEAIENTLKLARTHGLATGGPDKYVIVSFEGAFHGRTLGAQMAGGIPALKAWIGKLPEGFVQVPFPDGFRTTDTRFAVFEETLARLGVNPAQVAGVISETFQGIGPNFFPIEYARALETWCRRHDALLIMDEVQAGFGRTGKTFAFEHYGITPDLIACGKGISSSLPLAAVIGRADIMNAYAPGSMTSTHSASPLAVAAALENLAILKAERLTGRAAQLERPLRAALERIGRTYPDRVGALFCRGLVAGLLLVRPGTREPDGDAALAINEKCFQKGLLMFAPVGLGGGCIKIAPPLTIDREAIEEGCAVLEEAFAEVVGA
jgi:4-aminobutyrate aminotransferase/diaminobutyrate-pyruvate transaminase/4-aminobutyrate aminotransferase/(S)-3-amino-2-methylpropionate transaminase